MVSKKTVESSMARQGLCARPKRRHRGLAGRNPKTAATSDLLKRDFSATGINQKRCGDFKQANTDDGPEFLATVENLYWRRIVGFATSNEHPTAALDEHLRSLQQASVPTTD